MWTVKILNDTDDPKIGTITATYDDGFVFRARHETDQLRADNFIEKTLEAYAIHLKETGDTAVLEQAIAEKLNAA